MTSQCDGVCKATSKIASSLGTSRLQGQHSPSVTQPARHFWDCKPWPPHKQHPVAPTLQLLVYAQLLLPSEQDAVTAVSDCCCGVQGGVARQGQCFKRGLISSQHTFTTAVDRQCLWQSRPALAAILLQTWYSLPACAKAPSRPAQRLDVRYLQTQASSNLSCFKSYSRSCCQFLSQYHDSALHDT